MVKDNPKQMYRLFVVCRGKRKRCNRLGFSLCELYVKVCFAFIKFCALLHFFILPQLLQYHVLTIEYVGLTFFLTYFFGTKTKQIKNLQFLNRFIYIIRNLNIFNTRTTRTKSTFFNSTFFNLKILCIQPAIVRQTNIM